MNTLKGHWSKDNSFIDACVKPDGAIGIALSNDEMIKDNAPFSFLAVNRDGNWLEGGSANWDGVALTVIHKPLSQIAMFGPSGQVHITGSGDRHVEVIADNFFSPINYGLIRGARTIDGVVMACGMKKQVYRREDTNRWSCISQQIVGGVGVHGFEALDGFSINDVYAVGWGGEIWHFEGTTWKQCDSPYGGVLIDVCCAEDGVVYAVGRGYTLVTGRGDIWAARGTNLPVELSALCWFKDQLYAASTRDIFVLNNKGQFVPVAIPDDFPKTCGALATNGKILVSAGERDLFSFDGITWSRLD